MFVSSGLIPSNNLSLTSEFKLKCRYRRALVHFDLCNYSQVIEDCGEVLFLDAQNVPARALLGRAFKVLNEHQKAEEQLNNAILLDAYQAALYTGMFTSLNFVKALLPVLLERGDIRFRTGQRNKIVEAIYDFDQAICLYSEKLTFESGNAQQGVRAFKGPLFTQKKVGGRDETKAPLFEPMSSSSKRNNVIVPTLSRSFSRQMSKDPDDEMDENDFFLSPPASRRNSFESAAVSISNSNINSRQNALSRGSFQASNNNSISAVHRKELEEQLADTFYKRAQAKLLIECDSLQIEEALRDVLKAIEYCEEDDDYHLVASTCYLRLNEFDEARKILEKIIKKSPSNFKALYNLSYCKRIEGDSRNAIEELTKVSKIFLFIVYKHLKLLWNCFCR